MKRFNSIDIYKPSYGDCSNFGMSSKFEKVNIIELEEGENLKAIFESGLLKNNDVILIFEHDIWKAEDAIRKAQNNWLMFGGCFIFTSNGLVPHVHEGAVKLFDRYER